MNRNEFSNWFVRHRDELSWRWDSIWHGVLFVFLYIFLGSYPLCEKFHVKFDLSPRVMRVIDPVLWLLLLIGIFTIIGGLLRPYTRSVMERPHETVHSGDLMKEYELSQGMHNYYGTITWQIAAIFLGGGVAGLGYAIRTRELEIILFATLVFTILMGSFYLFARRNGKLALVHLARCRKIEAKLGLRQHIDAEFANEPAGVRIQGKTYRAPLPSGWQILKGLSMSLIILAWMITLYFSLAPKP